MTAQPWERAEALLAVDDYLAAPIPGQRRHPSPMAEIHARQAAEDNARLARKDSTDE